MKKRRFFAIITILAAGPALVFLRYLILGYGTPIIHWLVWEKIAIAFFCLIGGIMLWQGNIWGYRLSVLAWALIIFVHSSILILFCTNLDKLMFPSYVVNISLNVLFILAGTLTIVILLRDILRKGGRSESDGKSRNGVSGESPLQSKE